MEMVEKTDYKATRNVIVDYDIYVVRKQLHWLLLVRMKSSEFSFITDEITTYTFADTYAKSYLYSLLLLLYILAAPILLLSGAYYTLFTEIIVTILNNSQLLGTCAK